MTNEIDMSVGEALGLKLAQDSNEPGDWFLPDPDTGIWEHWNPSGYLTQAAAYIVPALDDLGAIVSIHPATKLNDGWQAHVEAWSPDKDKIVAIEYSDKGMAHALCQVFLKVTNNKTDEEAATGGVPA